MNYFHCLPILVAALFTLPPAARAEPSVQSRQDEYSLGRNHLAINGYDPVTYHQETGPSKGSKKITVEHKGVVYRFASEANKAEFLENPDKFEPEYGGWCAWAMLDGDRTEPNPESFKIVDGKLYLFYDGFFGDTRKLWNQKIADAPESALIEQADAQWIQQVN